jgi:hypothetical protein
MAGFYIGLIGCEETAKLRKSELKIYFVCELQKGQQLLRGSGGMPWSSPQNNKV